MRKMQEIDGRKLSKELQTEFRKRAIRAVKKKKTADTKLWKVINEAYQKE